MKTVLAILAICLSLVASVTNAQPNTSWAGPPPNVCNPGPSPVGGGPRYYNCPPYVVGVAPSFSQPMAGTGGFANVGVRVSGTTTQAASSGIGFCQIAGGALGGGILGSLWKDHPVIGALLGALGGGWFADKFVCRDRPTNQVVVVRQGADGTQLTRKGSCVLGATKETVVGLTEEECAVLGKKKGLETADKDQPVPTLLPGQQRACHARQAPGSPVWASSDESEKSATIKWLALQAGEDCSSWKVRLVMSK